ncbi:MAG: hypothetical protein ACJ8FV_08755 [Xanthobacteraceae bacterium]
MTQELAGWAAKGSHVRGSATIPGKGKHAVELSHGSRDFAQAFRGRRAAGCPQGKDYIAKQEDVIAELARDGHGTAQARALLDNLLESQALHEQHRGWLSEMAARP